MHAAPVQRPALVEVRKVADRVPGGLDALSHDGRYAAFGDGGRLVVVDLRTRRARSVAGRFDLTQPVAFAPHGALLSFVQRGRLRVAGRSARTVASGVRASLGWLRDGTLAYVDRRGDVEAVTIAGRARVLVPRLVPHGSASISPTGRYVLYTRGCTTRLLDRVGGRSRTLARGRIWGRGGWAPGPWSPDGTRFTLVGVEWGPHCASEQFAGFRVVDLQGHGVDLAGYPVWSADGRYVLAEGGVMGTAVTYAQPLRVYDVRTRRESVPLPDRFGYGAEAAPGGRLLYEEFDRTTRSPDLGGPSAPQRLYTARITTR